MADTTHHRPRVLVTGASIAGPALAWGLHREGFDVTLLERSAEQRQAGQNIDVRSLGRESSGAAWHGHRGRRHGEPHRRDGTRFVDEEGRVLATFPRAEGEDGPTAEVEILRGRFAGILVDPRARRRRAPLRRLRDRRAAGRDGGSTSSSRADPASATTSCSWPRAAAPARVGWRSPRRPPSATTA
ncbi:hypothetical protein ACFOD2_17745 [Clavibacter michiganensis subsp. insidiosus]|uniref:hypothetical protein n=1 Tax=Clavibacter michiganensis TaxID=28447 RepID=UPI00361B5A4D